MIMITEIEGPLTGMDVTTDQGMKPPGLTRAGLVRNSADTRDGLQTREGERARPPRPELEYLWL